MKPLNAILNEYVELKEADIRHKQLVQANPIVGDLLAVIESHAGKARDQPEQTGCQTGAPANKQHPDAAPAQGTQSFDNAIDPETSAKEPPFVAPANVAADQHDLDSATACQAADPHLDYVASSVAKPQTSSQHRKGAPRRRTDQADKLASPISRLALSSHGESNALSAAARLS